VVDRRDGYRIYYQLAEPKQEDISRAIKNPGDHPEGGEGAGVAVKKPKGPTVGSRSAAAKPDE
jgi:hypothetical protein